MAKLKSVNEVRVTAAARLHLGFLDLEGGLGRKFGGLGLAISGPRTRLTLARADATEVAGVEPARAGKLLARAQAALAPEAHCRLTVHEAIPAHAGLGSGTQLALAITGALRRLEDLAARPAVDAELLERGARSGLGAGLFEDGGFVVDGGRGPNGAIAPVVARLPFPPEWRILLVLDPNSAGLHGEAEREAFAGLPSFTSAQAGDLCRRVLMQALPALAERDLKAFGAAIEHIQAVVGDYFAPAQGGRRFASGAVERLVAKLTRAGAVGAGQSSWGPTGFAFVESDAQAVAIAARLRAEAKEAGLALEIVEGLAHGAKIEAVYAQMA